MMAMELPLPGAEFQLHCSRRGRARELLDQTLRDDRGDQAVTGGDHPHRGDQVLGQHVFQEEPAQPGTQSLVDVLVEIEGREHQDRDRLIRVRVVHDAARGLEPVQIGHLDVHQHDVGFRLRARATASRPSAASPSHPDARLRFEDRPETGPDERLVVSDQDRDALPHQQTV